MEISPGAPTVKLNQPAPPGDVPPTLGVPTNDLVRSVFKNSASQVAGRLFIAICRLVIAGFIIRSSGKGMFGEFSLVFGILSIADWLVDFGTTEVFVREICREPEQGTRLLRILTAAKIVQIPAAFLGLTAIMLLLRYPASIVAAGLVGGANVLFFGGTLIYRVLFRATLTIEREVVAELLSVVAMIPLVALACRSGGGLIVLMGCHLISRGIYFGLCFLFGRSRYRFSLQGVTKQDVNWGLRSSVAIGTIGFLVGGYEILDILLLSKLASFSELAYYSAAQRLIWPTLMAVAAVAGTFYPVMASYWPQDRFRFEEACQRGLDTVLVLGGFALCSVLAAAEFFMGLLGPELANGAPVLRVLALLCFVKAITSTVGPVLYVVKAQRQALQFIGIAVAAKAAVIALLTPRYGYMGVAFGALIAETFFAAVPAIYLIRKLSGFRVRWTVPLKVAMITMVAAVVPWLLSVKGLPAAVAAPGLYIPLAFLSGAVRLSEVQSLLKWKTP